MRIFDEKGNQIDAPDLTRGLLENDKIFIAHHAEILETKEEYHLEEIASYNNGGKDFIKIIDKPYQPYVAAWDEYEDIYRYILFTEEELQQQKEPSASDGLQAQVVYTAMRTDTLI